MSQTGGDPAAVAFDAVSAGNARHLDVVITDTAGRLPTQTNLMEELGRIRRSQAKALEGAPHEVILVVDGTNGQNALAQVKTFDAFAQLTGLIVTKLDGTAKGGVLVAITGRFPSTSWGSVKRLTICSPLMPGPLPMPWWELTKTEAYCRFLVIKRD